MTRIEKQLAELWPRFESAAREITEGYALPIRAIDKGTEINHVLSLLKHGDIKKECRHLLTMYSHEAAKILRSYNEEERDTAVIMHGMRKEIISTRAGNQGEAHDEQDILPIFGEILEYEGIDTSELRGERLVYDTEDRLVRARFRVKKERARELGHENIWIEYQLDGGKKGVAAIKAEYSTPEKPLVPSESIILAEYRNGQWEMTS